MWLIGMSYVVFLIIISDKRKKKYLLISVLSIFPLWSLFSYLKDDPGNTESEYVACLVPSENNTNSSAYDKAKMLLEFLERKKYHEEMIVLTPELFYSTSSKDLEYSDFSYLLAGFLNKNPYKLLFGAEIINDSVHKFNGITYIDKSSYLFRTKKKYVPITEYTPKILTPFFGMSNYLKNNNDDAYKMKKNIHSLPFVCYEILFSDFIAENSINSDKLLLLTSEDFMNDSFYGRKQYLNIVRLRAIENGRYLLKCSYKGRSVLISPKGDIDKTMSTTFSVTKVPLNNENTIYQSAVRWLSR
ncbi:hypothetical protein MKJ01_15135 [Chryseobacterium sp. SSA4.19]|nr:hypothetical protein [Chryseobacterium sp. SSA4.19]